MKRQLSDKVNWGPDALKIELADWKNNAEDFELLYRAVVTRLNDWLGTRKAEDVLSKERLRSEMYSAAEHFEEKHVSILLFVYMWMKVVIAREIEKDNTQAGDVR